MKTITNFGIGMVGLMCQYANDSDIATLTFISSDLINNAAYIPTKTIIIPTDRAIVNLLNELHKIDFDIKDTITTFGVGITGIICQYFSTDENVGLIIGEGMLNKSTTITINGTDSIERLIYKLENIVEGLDEN